MKKPEEMTVPQYNELMMKDAEEMLKKAWWCVKESQARLQIAANAVVPQQFYPFFEAIARIEGSGATH